MKYLSENSYFSDENSNSSLASSILSNPSCSTNSQVPATSFYPQTAGSKSDSNSPISQNASVTSNIFASSRRKARIREV